MMKFASLLLLLLPCTCVLAQGPIDFTVNINTQQITQTDASIFKTLERDLALFLNQTPWSEDRFEEEERIEASIFLTVREVEKEGNSTTVMVPNRFEATLAIQSSRPIYGTSEITPVFNYQDKLIEFGYKQFEALQISEQSFTGELANIMAFYAYIILGFDYDTFSPQGGQPYFEKAQELYNRLPNAIQGQPGWVSSGKDKNRYSLMENLLQPRMLPMRRAYYTYHRLGLDLMTTDVLQARNNITLAIEDAKNANQAYLNSVYAQAFVDAKREEIINIYKGATGPEQNAIITTMQRLDPANSGEYRTMRLAPNARRNNTATTRPGNRTSLQQPRQPFGKQ